VTVYSLTKHYPNEIEVLIKRLDDQPFFLQDRAKYSVITQYNPDLDPRLEIKLRIDLADRSYLIEKIRIENDPAKLLKELSSKYGFPAIRTTQVRFAPETPWATGQEIRITFRTPISCEKVNLEKFTRREFTLYNADDPWESGELLMPSSWRKDQIWAGLQRMHSIPDVSQFQVMAGGQEISKQNEWPAGRIEAAPFKSPVKWQIEDSSKADGYFECTQNEMTPLISAREAWTQLRFDHQTLYENVSLDFSGFLKPGLTIMAGIIRENVRVSVSFEVIRGGSITFIQEVFLNMVSWRDTTPGLMPEFRLLNATLTKNYDRAIQRPH
jgi:hypothetical protein